MESRNLLTKVKKILPVVLVILSAVTARVLPHPPNFAPITGIALFSASFLPGYSAFILPLLIMFVSDLFLGFHSTMFYVYGSFFLIALLGKLTLRKNNNIVRLTSVSFISSLLFFVITNFGVWINTELYPMTLFGLKQSYVMGLPFFKNTLFGDFFYTFSLFYGFRFIGYLLNQVFLLKNPPNTD